MKINELKQNLQAKKESLYLVVGTEESLIQSARKIFLDLLSPAEREMNFSEFDLEQTNIIEAVGEANSLPFLGEYRLIFIKNPLFLTNSKSSTADQDLDKFIEYIDNPQLTSIVVIFANFEKLDKRKKITKILQQKSQLVEAEKLNAGQIKQILQKKVAKKGFTAETDALDQLIMRTNNDYSIAQSELNKLFVFAMETKTITKNDVEELVPQTLDDNVFDLIDAILQGNLSRAESCYQQLLILKNDPIALTALAQTQIRLLLQVKILANQGMSQGKLAQFLQVHPYRVKLALQRVGQYPLPKLKKALSDLIEMDFQMKTGQGDKERLFELFFINFIANKKTA